MRKIINFLFIISVCVSILALPVYSATYSIPTISSTICTNCGTSMSYVREEIEEYSKSILGIYCPNTEDQSTASYVYHDHNFRRYYATYSCNNCTFWGRMLTRTTMQCEVGMNEYSLHP